MKRMKKQVIIGFLISLIAMVAVVLMVSQTGQPLNAKEKTAKVSQKAVPNGIARSLDFYLRRAVSSGTGTGIDNVKFCIEAKTGEDTWEKVTGTNGKVEEFTTKEGGRIQIVERKLQELENKYGQGPYRFYQLTQPEGNYQTSIGHVSSEFTLPDEKGHWQKVVTMTNWYIGTYTLKVSNPVPTTQPLSGVKMVLQYYYNGTYHNFEEEIEGIPEEFTSNALGEVTLSAAQLSKLVGYKVGNSAINRFRLCVVGVPPGYLLPTMGNQYFTLSMPSSVISSETISVYPNRELTFQKTDRLTGVPLPGAEFELEVKRTSSGAYETVSNPEIPLPELKTDQNGQIKLSEAVLASLNKIYGTSSIITYRFKEIKAPVGYRPPTESSVTDTFSITNTAVNPKKITMSNEKMSEELVLQKLDAVTNVKLKDASFVVEKQNGESWTATTTTGKTNNQGQIVLKKNDLSRLGNGTYRFKETAAPAGYEDPTDNTVSETFEILDGSFVSKEYLIVRNVPKEKGEVYLNFLRNEHSFKNALDSHSGKGYVTAEEAARGWIRSNDTFKMSYTIAPDVFDNKKYYENVKIRVSAEVVDGKGYSDYADKTKEPLQNVRFNIASTNALQLDGNQTYDPETRTVKAYQDFVFPEAPGPFMDMSIEATVGSTFFGTELPLKYTMQIISAVDPETAEEVQFDQGSNAHLYFYDLSLPIPNNTLKVTSKLNMTPVVSGYNGTTNSYILKKTFEELTGSKDYPKASVASIGYGWATSPLDGRGTNSELGLAVPKGNNQFNMILDQRIIATLSNNDVVNLTLGDGPNADLPMIKLFSYGKVGETFGTPVGIYSGYMVQSPITTSYNNFASPGQTVNYSMSQNANGDLSVTVSPPTYFPGTSGRVTDRLFGVGSYLVYPAEAASIVAARQAKAASSVIQQDYTIAFKGASYEDNDGESIEFSATEKPNVKSTWTETFDENKPEKPKDERFLIMEKKDRNDGFLLTGGKFILEHYGRLPGSSSYTWNPVDVTGFESFSLDENGQIVFDEAMLTELYEKVGSGKYRFKEVEAPPGYRDPDDYEDPKELISGEFNLEKNTISTRRVGISNRPKHPILVVKKSGKNQAGAIVSLEGAVFDLYFGKPKKENPSKDEDYEWVRVDIEKVFNLTEAEAKEKFTSETKGEIRLTKEDIATLAKDKNYGPGRYRFKEIIPPPNYILPEGDNAFTSSFHLTEDDVSPNEITMENQRVAEWKDESTNTIGSAYGYSVEKDGVPMFSKLSDSYLKADSLAKLQSRAEPFSKTATNYGKVLRGEEIVVGSYQNATYYSYATDNTSYIENWKAKEAEMIQIWNPAEGELLEAGYNFFENMAQIGTTAPIRYGVKKDDDYTLKSLREASINDYDWYPTMGAVPEGKKISAVHGKITQFKANYRGIHDKTVETRWNLYTRRKANGAPGNYSRGLSGSSVSTGYDYYMTLTRAKITYENYKPNGEEDKEVTKNWGTESFTPARYAKSQSGDTPGLSSYNPSPVSSFGDTLLILPYYRPTFSKKALNPETQTPQNTYALNSMMEFSLEVEFPTPREGTVMDTYPFDFRVTDDVNYQNQPEDHFIYRKNSAYLNDQPIENPINGKDGSTNLLDWKEIPGSYKESNVYSLHFQAFPKKVGAFVNRAAVHTFYGYSGQNITVTITDALSSGGVYKNTSTPVIAQANNLEDSPTIDYTITIQNYVPEKLLKGIKIFDRLPFDGDQNGSEFHGGYSLEKMSAERIDGTPLNDEETTYYYTTQALPEDLNPNEAFDYPGANWKEFKEITDEEKKEVKAVFVTMPDLPSGMSYVLSLELLPFGNKENDRYYNRAKFGFNITDAYGQDIPAQVRSKSAQTVVINRVIEGNVWQDLHYSGIMEPDEPKIPGVDVKLYQQRAGELFEIDETKTDSAGQYRFDGVPSGNFKVGFKLPEAYSGYIVTKTNVEGADPLLTNKVSQVDITEDDYHLTQNPIQMPFFEYEKDEEGNDTEKLKSLIEIKGINMGILPRPDLTVVKEVQKKDEKEEYHDIDGGKVKIGDILRYVITVSNPVAESYLEDIRIQDTLPAGLEYVEGTLTLVKEAPEEDEVLPSSKYTFAENENGYWELQTDSLGNLQSSGDKIQIYFDVRVTSKAKGKLTNIATASGSLPPELNYRENDTTENHITPNPTMTKEASWEGKDDEKPKPLKKGQEFTYTLTVKNAEGASEWMGVTLSDTLNSLMGDPENPEDYLVYVPNSTTVNGVSVRDADSWKEPNKLTLNLGDFEGSAEGTEKVVQFKVKLNKIPPKDSDGKIWIRNEATAVGKGINAEDEEQDYPTSANNEFLLENYQSAIKLHVRQVVVKPEDSLVVPKEGYLMLHQLKEDNQPVVNGMTSIQMTSEKEGAQITTDSFTTVLVSLLGDVQTLDLNLPMIPEYYEYLGSVVSTDSARLAVDHVSSKLEKDVRPKLSVEDHEEYWVTLFIQPKLNEEDQNLPRPYSWDTVSNQFGKLKSEE